MTCVTKSRVDLMKMNEGGTTVNPSLRYHPLFVFIQVIWVVPRYDRPLLWISKGFFICVPGMARFLLVKVQSRVFTAERSGAQAADSNGCGGGSA